MSNLTNTAYPIDVFVPWVNPNDDSWYSEYCNACQMHTGDKSPQRIRDFGTFRFLLRSIATNMPWVHKIHILLYSTSQIPSWLNVADEQIEIHTHSEICKPSFNQLYFTRYVGNLPSLAEHFIYLCDDQVILNPTNPTDWFVDGIPTDDAMESSVISSNPYNEEDLLSQHITADQQIEQNTLDFFQRIVKNTLFAASAASGVLKIYKNYHCGISCIKSEYHHYMSSLNAILDKMFDNFWFRNDNQVVPHWLYRYIRLSLGNYAHVDPSKRKYREIIDANVGFIRADKLAGYTVCCLNDILGDDTEFDAAKTAVTAVLTELFPAKSKYEV